VQEVDAATNAIIELGGQLAAEGIEQVTIESTSDYWRPFFYLLEAAGLAVQLVNAHDVKTHRAARNRQTGCGMAGEADRAGHAAALPSSPRPRSGSCAITPGCAPT
jgi:hypothetical protein